MKVELRAGHTLELVSPGELREILGDVFPARRGPELWRPVQALALDANGAGTVELDIVQAGMRFRLHRLYIDADGYTPADPYTNASATDGYAEILQAGSPRSSVVFSSGTGGIPADWSSSVGIGYHEHEAVEIAFVGGPASTVVVCRGEGVLEPLTTR